ncbi:hypothetical protein BBP40_003528 [Aspergillus hancockii]|nr:hypothetical protein BBP40_003528 [Aspergillus hancockii]
MLHALGVDDGMILPHVPDQRSSMIRSLSLTLIGTVNTLKIFADRDILMFLYYWPINFINVCIILLELESITWQTADFDITHKDYVPMMKFCLYSGFYLRLDRRRYMKWAAYVLMLITLGIRPSNHHLFAFSCNQPSKFWDLTGATQGICADPRQQQMLYDSKGLLNIITDILVYILPIIMLWGVRIPKRQKGTLFYVFGLGITSVAAGCVRFDYVRILADNITTSRIRSAPIFCGSALSLSVILKTYGPSLLGSSTQKTGESNQNPEYPSSIRLTNRPGTNYKARRRQAPEDTELGDSQEVIVPAAPNTKQPKKQAHIHLEVTNRRSEGEAALQRI